MASGGCNELDVNATAHIGSNNQWWSYVKEHLGASNSSSAN